jgi:hypothetical protein
MPILKFTQEQINAMTPAQREAWQIQYLRAWLEAKGIKL